MAKKVADIYQVDTCMNHVYGLTMTKYVRSDWEIDIHALLFSRFHVFVDDMRDAPSG